MGLATSRRAVVVVGLILGGLLASTGFAGASGAGTGPSPSATSVAEGGLTPDFLSGVNTLLTPTPVGSFVGDPTLGTFVMTNVPAQISATSVAQVKVISTSAYRVVARTNVSASSQPRLAVDMNNGTLFVTNVSGSVSLYDGRTLARLGTVALAPQVTSVVYDAVDGDAWLAESCLLGVPGTSANVTVVNATNGSVLATIPFPCSPFGLLVDTDNGNVFVLSGTEGNLTLLSGTNFTALASYPSVSPTLIPGIAPTAAMTFDPRDGNAYVRCVVASVPGCVAVVNGSGALVAVRHLTTEIQNAFVVDGQGKVDFLGWSNGTVAPAEALYQLTPPNGSVARIGDAPCVEDALNWNPVIHALFAVAHCDPNSRVGSLTLFNGASFDGGTTIPVSNTSFLQFPRSGDVSEVDPATGVMAVVFPSTFGGSGVGLLGPFPVSFDVRVYTLGVYWTLNLTYPGGFSAAYTTRETSLTFWVPNGTYSFTYSVPTGYAESSTGGTFTMAGAPVHETLAVSWAWWYWLALAASGLVLVFGLRAGRRARTEFHVRRAEATAKLRADLHREPDETYRPGPPGPG